MIVYEKVFKSSFQAVDVAVMEIISALRDKCPHIDKSNLFKINFMMRELLNNAVEHGNKFDERKVVSCLVEYDSNSLKFQISDEGTGIEINTSIDMGDDIRKRNRGYETIAEMDFEIDIRGNSVLITFDLDKEG